MSDQTTPVWLTTNDCNLVDFQKLTATVTTADAVPMADTVIDRIPVYHGATILATIDDAGYITALLSEWNRVFDSGAGVLMIRGAFADTVLIERVTEALNRIIATEAMASASAGDHFAAAGANSRVWNSHEKLAAADPGLFAAYYKNPIMHLASRAWLGPAYQITAQVNVVHPGGHAQVCHRDYHLGFQGVDQLAAYPRNVHRISAHLTLQGAVAHTTMPIESGPTKVLPYSQQYLPGYVATQLPAFRTHFEAQHVQLPLAAGDMMFFNPAVFHAAGDNNTPHDRFANLLQIGSAFGRTTELVNRTRLCRLMYPVLIEAQQAASMTQREVDDVVAATAEGYAFPCNLDLTPPIDGMAPQSQQQLMRDCLQQGRTAGDFTAMLDQWVGLQRSL